MFRFSVSRCIFTFAFLDLFIKTYLTVHDNSHGFISNKARYFEDGLNSIDEEMPSFHTSAFTDVSLKLLLKFEPSFLDFKERPIGIPHIEKVTLFNGHSNKSIDMTSISGSTVHFHSSFFEDKRIPPMGNTSFNVVFLGRQEGRVESNLFIHTSEGYLKYNVKGASIFSQYRLRPIVGVKLPLNASFLPLIYMHNPFPEPIQITEIYSSGGDFHLELPTGEQEGPNDMWKIAPFQTKAVIRVRFEAKVVQNHTAYVRIKLNKPSEILIVPIEIEVTPSGGPVHPQGFVDFGMGGTLDQPTEKKLCIFNPLRKPIKVHSVSTTSKAIKIEFDTVKLMPKGSNAHENKCVDVASLKLDWETAFKTDDYAGKLLIKFRNGRNKTEIPYYISVLSGGISFDYFVTRYLINDKSIDSYTRNFKMKNEFSTNVQVVNYSFPADVQNMFKIDNFRSVLLKPNQEDYIFTLRLKRSVNLANLKVKSHIKLRTNVTDIYIPLLSYNGKLEVHLPFKSKDYSLDLGLMSYDSSKDIYFVVVNHNPVTVAFKNVVSSIPMTSAEIYGCGKGSYELALLQLPYKNLTKCISLSTNSFAVVRLSVQTSNAEGQIWGDIQIETQYENLSVPVHFKIAPGKLEIGPDRLVFDQCFPGKICSHPLRVHSTFNDPMIIEDIITMPQDGRVTSKYSGHIIPHTSKVVGHLYLNPDIECVNQCYTGLQNETTVQWLNSFGIAEYMPEFDVHLLNKFYNRYLNVTSNGSRKWQNLTLRLDTSEVRGHIFKTRVKMSWPNLVLEHNIENKSDFAFPLTQVGNISYQTITIRNPSSHNLVVQVMFEEDYPDIALLYESLPLSFLPQKSGELDKSGDFFFRENYTQQMADFESLINVTVLERSVPFYLLPGQNFSVVVGFRAKNTELNSALLIIRNNLTILEVIRFKGQGAYPFFKFGNRKPGSVQPLLFELTEKHLKDCEKDMQHNSNSFPHLTVKRSFTARNVGDITIFVNSLYINDYPCEGYGFKIINCFPFVLPPNSTRKIDIAFTPDFTLTKISRTLILGTSLNYPVNYTLFTTIPSNYLSLCSKLIKRPYWEMYLSYAAITLMFTLLMIIVFVAAMDAERIKKQAISAFIAPNTSSVQPVLDLRLVGQQTREEIKSTKTDHIQENNLGDTSRFVENFQIKQDPEKYTTVMPSATKSKKKLGKRNSNELNPNDCSESQKKHFEMQKVMKQKPEISKTKVEVKKTLINKKCFGKNTIVPAFEEESSSTATEGSSNYDDPEKENQRCFKVCPKRGCSKPENVKSAIEDQQNIEIVKALTVHGKLERQKSGFKQNQKSNKEQETKDEQNTRTSNREHRKGNKNARERKDKLFNKKSSEKNCSKSSETHKCSTVRTSPVISSAIWGENRAKFSDVVARSDNNNVNRPLCQTNNSHKPTMYVEPYKQSTNNVELGPIGSRRIDYWHDESNESSSIRHMSNSYFSNARDLVDHNQGFFDNFSGPENWNHPQNALNILEPGDPQGNSISPTTTMEDPWNADLLNTSAYWNNNFSSFLSENLHQQPSAVQSPGYLWGSSSVWQPWSPSEATRTPTRTPPGFDDYVQKKKEEQPLSQPERYSPFNNIWTQQPSNTWNYTQDQ